MSNPTITSRTPVVIAARVVLSRLAPALHGATVGACAAALLSLLFLAGCGGKPTYTTLDSLVQRRLSDGGGHWRDAYVCPTPNTLRFSLDASRPDYLQLRIGVKRVFPRVSGGSIQIFRGRDLIREQALAPGTQWQDFVIDLPAAEVSYPSELSVGFNHATPIYISHLQLLDGSRQQPNILVFLADTLRRDHMGVYGYARDTSPHTDAFARDAVIFTNAVSSSSWTRPAVASLFTGLLPETHGVNRFDTNFRSELPSIVPFLRDAGYVTLGYSANANVMPPFGFDRGFEQFTYQFKTVGDDVLVDKALAGLRNTGRQPWLVYIQAMGPHSPYDPPEELWGRYQGSQDYLDRDELYEILDEAADTAAGASPEDALDRTVKSLFRAPRDSGPAANSGPPIDELIARPRLFRIAEALYDGEIHFTDRQFQRVLEDLKSRGEYDNTLVIFLSDHGEEFNDHGGTHHGTHLHNELVRIPLIVKPPSPNGTPRGTRPDVVSITDLALTILDYAQLEPSWRMNGRSLRPVIDGDRLPHRPAKTTLAYESRYLHGLQDASNKVIYDEIRDRTEYFDLRTDPAELSPSPEPLPGTDASLNSIYNVTRMYRPGLRLYFVLPFDEHFNIRGSIQCETDGELRFQRSYPERQITNTENGWEFAIEVEPDLAHSRFSAYYRPIMFLPVAADQAVFSQIEINGRIVFSESFLPNRARGPLPDHSGVDELTEPLVRWWYPGGPDDAGRGIDNEEIVEELRALGYLR